MKVIESTASNIIVGSELAENTQINVPENTRVLVLQTPECRALEIKGPYQGSVVTYLQKQRGFWRRASDLLGRLSGTADGQFDAVGGTRGAPLPNACK